jgi:hypothetical protein
MEAPASGEVSSLTSHVLQCVRGMQVRRNASKFEEEEDQRREREREKGKNTIRITNSTYTQIKNTLYTVH